MFFLHAHMVFPLGMIHLQIRDCIRDIPQNYATKQLYIRTVNVTVSSLLIAAIPFFLKWDVHRFPFNVIQLLFSTSYSTRLKASNLANCTLWMFSFIIFSARNISVQLTLSHAPQLKISPIHLQQTTWPQSPEFLFCHQKHSIKNA